MRIKTKLHLSVIVSVAAAAIIIPVVIFVGGKNADDHNRNSQYNDLVVKIFALNTLTASYTIQPMERTKDQWESVHASLEKMLGELKPKRVQEKAILASLLKAQQELAPTFSKLVGMKNSESPYSVNLKNILENQMSVRLQGMLNAASRLMQENRKKIMESDKWTDRSIVFLLLLLIVTVGGALLYTSSKIVRSVLAVSEGTRLIAAKKWDHKVPITGDDEIGDLARDFNEMACQLSSAYGDLEREIAERKMAEQKLKQYQDELEQKVEERTSALRKSGEHFRALVEASSGALYRMSPDWKEMRQLHSRGFLANTEKPNPAWLQEYIHPDDQPLVTSAIHEAIRTKSVFELEHRVLRADGSLGWLFSRAVPLLDANGELIEWFGAASDITERKQGEEALRQSEERFVNAFESSPNALVISDIQTGKIQLVNAAFLSLFRYHREEVIGRTSTELGMIDPVERQEIVRALKSDGSVREQEVDILTKEGTFRHASLWTVPIGMGLEDIMLTTILDITDRKRAEDSLRRAHDVLEVRVQERTSELKKMNLELKRSNDALQDFASIASHDLQEPLRKVQMFGDLLKTRYESALDVEGKDYVFRMTSASKRMQTLLNVLLNYARVTTKSKPFVEISLNHVVQDVLTDLESRLQRTGGNVEVETLPTVEADPSQMNQLFQNLIGNALKFHKGSEKPLVKVSSQPGNGLFRISISDNGIGFDEQLLEKIFAPFQRLHGKTSSYEGTGMGLAICKKIVERHGGTIEARSAPGVGSTFIVSLPMRVGPQSLLEREIGKRR